jgi:hypothetical protein
MKSFSEKIIFQRLVRTKKLRKAKMQLLPESGKYVWPDVAGFRRQQYSGGWMLPDSGVAWIPTIGYQTCVEGRKV